MHRWAPYLLVLLLLCQAAGQELRVTRLNEGYLRDDVGLFDREERKVITDLLQEQSQKPLGRIYLDILEKLPSDLTIEQYARKRLNDSFRIPTDKSDKIMIVVVLKDRAVRIETSRDVWPKLPDEYCHQVNREVMIPKFKTGAYFAGLKVGIEALMEKLNAP